MPRASLLNRGQVFLLEPLEEEVERLRDEVDVLRPMEASLSKAEENLAR